MRQTDIAIIGAGPAGLMAAIQAAEMGAQVLLLERANELGGQMIKQTHKFFGSREDTKMSCFRRSRFSSRNAVFRRLGCGYGDALRAGAPSLCLRVN